MVNKTPHPIHYCHHHHHYMPHAGLGKKTIDSLGGTDNLPKALPFIVASWSMVVREQPCAVKSGAQLVDLYHIYNDVCDSSALDLTSQAGSRLHAWIHCVKIIVSTSTGIVISGHLFNIIILPAPELLNLVLWMVLTQQDKEHLSNPDTCWVKRWNRMGRGGIRGD